MPKAAARFGRALPGVIPRPFRANGETLPTNLNSAPLAIGRHVSGIADPFNGHIDEFRMSHIQRSDGWIETTWHNMSDPGAFAVEEQERGPPRPLAGAAVVVCVMG
jgi:hypothetical protein